MMKLFGNSNWQYWLIFLAMFEAHSVPAHSGGGATIGGGDLCEDRIKVIRNDLFDWIQQGGPNALQLPARISVKQYADTMMKAIQNAKIQCIGPRDRGYPVLVDGTPKICRFDQDTTDSRITCDFQKFQSLSLSDQYVLIHHEYAGLSGIEQPNGDDSTYEISNQISDFLENNRLNVKTSEGPHVNVCRLLSDAYVECTFAVYYRYTNAQLPSPVSEEFYTQFAVRFSKYDDSFCKIWDANNPDNSVPCKKIQRSNHSDTISRHTFSIVSKPDYLARVLKENCPSPIAERFIDTTLWAIHSSKSQSFKIDFSCAWSLNGNEGSCNIPSTTLSAPDLPGETVTLTFLTKPKPF